MATQRHKEIAEALGISEAAIDAFIKRHDEFLRTGASYIDAPGPNASTVRIFPNWPLFYKFVDHTIGKPSTSELKPNAVDPLKEVNEADLPTDEEMAAALAPVRKLPPPPEPE